MSMLISEAKATLIRSSGLIFALTASVSIREQTLWQQAILSQISTAESQVGVAAHVWTVFKVTSHHGMILELSLKL